MTIGFCELRPANQFSILNCGRVGEQIKANWGCGLWRHPALLSKMWRAVSSLRPKSEIQPIAGPW